MDICVRSSLSVLYQSSNTYVLPTGISLTSLLYNCAEIDDLYIYILDDGIDASNKAKLDNIANKFGRKINYIETTSFKNALVDLGIEPFSGSYATYFKLLALGSLDFPTNQVLYIDGDTIIDRSLIDLLDVQLEDDQILSAVIDLYLPEYKSILGIPLNEPYFNCGILLIEKKKWRSAQCTDKIIDHLKEVHCKYSVADQDIMNVLFRDRINVLSLKYNFNPSFYLFGIEGALSLYQTSSTIYYSKNDIINALDEGPAIYHCLGGMTGRPWEKKNYHPQNDLFDKYLRMTDWKESDKYVQNKSRLFKLQSLAYKILPKAVYLQLHSSLLKRYLHHREKAN